MKGQDLSAISAGSSWPNINEIKSLEELLKFWKIIGQ
jgi:hypothetical protein